MSRGWKALIIVMAITTCVHALAIYDLRKTEAVQNHINNQAVRILELLTKSAVPATNPHVKDKP